MTREHTPRPGVTWQQQPTRTETVVHDADGQPWTVTPWLEAEPDGPFDTGRLANREQRRALKRAQRKGGRS